MRNRSYKHIGKEVSRAVRRVVRSGNFAELGRAVDDGVRQFTDYGNEIFKDIKQTVRRPPYTYPQNTKPVGTSPKGSDGFGPPVYSGFRSRMPGSISGLVCSIVGASLGIPLLIADIAVFIVGVTGSIALSNYIAAASVLVPFTAVSFGLMGYGIALRRRARRFARYRDAMGGAVFCSIDKLADIAGETPERTKKDLKKMISSGACPQGHFDRDETCFMVDDKTYNEFLQAEKEYAARMQAAQAEEEKKQAGPKETELLAAIEEGNGYLRQIRAVNDALPGEIISEKLDKLESVTARIFDCVRQHPEKLPDIRRFMRYYMPTTLKLVKSYEEFETQPVQGENITKAKQEIERALDTVNVAFANLLDSLFADEALDISADISTLETMLKQEGLTGNDFEKTSGSNLS